MIGDSRRAPITDRGATNGLMAATIGGELERARNQLRDH
jgi:hypothetical protein